MSRVLLINPPKEVPLLDWTMRYPPLGLMSVAAALSGHQVEILDMKVEKTGRKALAAKLASADIVGITVLTPSIDSAIDICAVARQCGVLTVLGGPHPTLMPGIVEHPDVDIVVRGEGELTFREIADGRPLDSIEGISYVGPAGVVHNPERPSADLAALAPPRRDLVERYRGRYNAFGRSMGALSTARGCPYRCSFCCVHKLWRGFRELSPQAVIAELKRMEPTEIVSIVDDNFCEDMLRVEAICDLIIREGLNDRIYSVFSRVDSIVAHPEVVRKMALANMRVVFIGIEAATQAALDRMRKKTRIEDTFRACEILEANGMLIWAGHIIGNLDDSRDDVEALILMSLELPIDIADFTVITPYPGTDLYDLASRRNLIDEYDFAEYCECEPHMHTPNLSRMEIMELQIKAYMKFYGFWRMLGRARRWSRNRAKRWILEGNVTGIRSFWKYRSASARYFWRTYRQTVGKTEHTKIRRFSPLVSTPRLYSIAAGIGAALIVLALTVFEERFYGGYSRSVAFIIADQLFASVFVAFTVAAVATWLAVRSYRSGWIFSVRPRKPARGKKTVGEAAFLNGLVSTALALFVMAIVILVMVLAGHSSSLNYGAKEIAVTAIAFLVSCVVSFRSVHAVRNGGISRRP